MSNALVLAYGFGGVIFLALMGLFWGWLVKPVVPLALKSRAERDAAVSQPEPTEQDCFFTAWPPAQRDEGGRPS